MRPVLLPFLLGLCLNAEVVPTLQVDTRHPGAKVSPSLWGIFFEDINFGADGGLYAELVKNRSFEFPDALMGWKATGRAHLQVLEDRPGIPSNPHYLRLGAETSGAGVVNEGFRGMGIHQGESYAFKVMVRGSLPLKVELVAPDGHGLAEAMLPNGGGEWQWVRTTLVAKETVAKASLRLSALQAGEVDLDHVSLFPRHTWRERPEGLRADLVQALADMKPGVLRFPGGCIVEGRTLANRYEWKATLGAPESRSMKINRWNTEFKHRSAPDYFQSFGLGFLEYFQLAEDIGAEPLPILNCGMACQFNSGELAPLNQLDPYIQDALDLIAFANAPISAPWGAKRAALGHPAPFHLKRLGVGNEQWGPAYFERFARFAEALKKEHPEIELVAAAGPSPADDQFQAAWKAFRELKADIVDEHCYDRPDWFYQAVHRYDHYDRKGPKVFMGEYAAQSVGTGSTENRNTWACALAEAAFMTGLERNSDVVVMSSYAPLFGHVEAWQWRPDLIWMDNLKACRTANYWVQFLFSRNRGEVVIPVRLEGAEEGQTWVSATRVGQELVLKVAHAGAQPRRLRLEAPGLKPGQAVAITLKGQDGDENTLEDPDRVVPETRSLSIGADFQYLFPARSLTVLRLPLK